MDSVTLYMVVTLASAGQEATVLQHPFQTAEACQRSAGDMAAGRIATRYRKQGYAVKVFCGPPKKPIVIAR